MIDSSRYGWWKYAITGLIIGYAVGAATAMLSAIHEPNYWRTVGLQFDPFGLALGPLGALIAIAIRNRALRAENTRRVRREAGLCANCEYDLRGNTSGVCPECGTPATPSSDAGRARNKRITAYVCFGLAAGTVAISWIFVELLNQGGLGAPFALITLCILVPLAMFFAALGIWFLLPPYRSL